MRQFTQGLVESEFGFRLRHFQPSGVLVWFFGSRPPEGPLPASVLPEKPVETGEVGSRRKGARSGSDVEPCPREGGLPLGSVPRSSGVSLDHTSESPSENKGVGHVHLCTPHSQAKGFPSRPKLLSTPGAAVVGKVDSGSPRAVVPQSDPGAGGWSAGTWELVFAVEGP